MATYYLDSSAVVKRYAAETGSAWVSALCDPASGNTIVISQAALVEVVAALCRKGVQGASGKPDRDRAIGLFRKDANESYGQQRVTKSIYMHAGDLCQRHNLRAYDAIQLACALALRDKLAPLGVAPVFVCADKNLLSCAWTEGLSVDDPNAHP